MLQPEEYTRMYQDIVNARAKILGQNLKDEALIDEIMVLAQVTALHRSDDVPFGCFSEDEVETIAQIYFDFKNIIEPAAQHYLDLNPARFVSIYADLQFHFAEEEFQNSFKAAFRKALDGIKIVISDMKFEQQQSEDCLLDESKKEGKKKVRAPRKTHRVVAPQKISVKPQKLRQEEESAKIVLQQCLEEKKREAQVLLAYQEAQKQAELSHRKEQETKRQEKNRLNAERRKGKHRAQVAMRKVAKVESKVEVQELAHVGAGAAGSAGSQVRSLFFTEEQKSEWRFFCKLKEEKAVYPDLLLMSLDLIGNCPGKKPVNFKINLTVNEGDSQQKFFFHRGASCINVFPESDFFENEKLLESALKYLRGIFKDTQSEKQFGISSLVRVSVCKLLDTQKPSVFFGGFLQGDKIESSTGKEMLAPISRLE